MTPFYERNGITIYCGDCLEVMPGLAGPVDAIIADLPYGTTACAWDTVIPFEPLWVNYRRLIKRAGAVVLFGSEPFSSLLRVSNLGWYKYDWVWEKTKPSGHLNAKKQPMRSTENISIFGNGEGIYNPQGLIRGRFNNNRPSRSTKVIGKYVHGQERQIGISEHTNYPVNVLRYSNPNNDTLHPTQKPVALLSYLIRTYTNPGELILDNTMGSGTTLLAAQNEGRRAIGIEISEEYCKIAVDRLRQPSFFSIAEQPTKVEVKQDTMNL